MLPMTFPDIGQRTGLVLMKIVGLRPDLSTKIDVIVTGFVFMKIAGLGPDLLTKIDVIVTWLVFTKLT